MSFLKNLFKGKTEEPTTTEHITPAYEFLLYEPVTDQQILDSLDDPYVLYNDPAEFSRIRPAVKQRRTLRVNFSKPKPALPPDYKSYVPELTAPRQRPYRMPPVNNHWSLPVALAVIGACS